MGLYDIDLNVILPRSKIKKYLRLSNEIFRNIPLGDAKKVCSILNEEFADFFLGGSNLPNKINHVTIKDKMSDDECVFEFVHVNTRIIIELRNLDDVVRLRKNYYYGNHYERKKRLSLSSFIYDYCNPEGLLIIEKVFLNYI